jgi:hypothetical protein
MNMNILNIHWSLLGQTSIEIPFDIKELSQSINLCTAG